MKRILIYVGIFIAVVMIFFLGLYTNGDIGIQKVNIEKDARSSQSIPDEWQVAKDTTNIMSAMIFYDEKLNDHTFSIYVNSPGISFGYFFRRGGTTGASITDGIAEFYIDGYNERAFISLNRHQVSKVEIDNGISVEIVEIESTKLFAFILPLDIGSVTIYDINGNVVESQREW